MLLLKICHLLSAYTCIFQEVRRLNERMMQLQQERREEVSQLETALEQVKTKAYDLEETSAEREKALAQVGQTERQRERGAKGGGRES